MTLISLLAVLPAAWVLPRTEGKQAGSEAGSKGQQAALTNCEHLVQNPAYCPYVHDPTGVSQCSTSFVY